MKKLVLLFGSVLLLSACGENNKSEEINKETIVESSMEQNKTQSSTSEKENSTTKNFSQDNAAVESTEKMQKKEFNIGEEVIFYDDNNNEIYSLTIKKVSTELVAFSDFETVEYPDKTIEIVYEYKNYNYGEPLNIESQFITAFGADGKAGEDFGYRNGQNDVGEGRSAEATIWYTMPEEITKGYEIEIDYGSDFITGFNDFITFKGTVE